jgi:hypothetical protein
VEGVEMKKGELLFQLAKLIRDSGIPATIAISIRDEGRVYSSMLVAGNDPPRWNAPPVIDDSEKVPA